MTPACFLALALSTICPVPTVVSVERGVASFYWPTNSRFGHSLAVGGYYDPENDQVCAHKTLAFGTLVRITDDRTGRWIECYVMDRGPYIKGRIIDLSVAGARQLGIEARGITPVKVEVLR